MRIVGAGNALAAMMIRKARHSQIVARRAINEIAEDASRDAVFIEHC